MTNAEKYIHSLNKFGKKSGLDNITRLLNELGNPQDKLKFVHIAGTNGKGSVSSFISQIMIESGYKTGLFTSPFIEVFNERIKINNQNISDSDLEKYTDIVKNAVDKLKRNGDYNPIEFEVITAAAFLYFADQKCDIAVLEVGLGGRLDCTNVIKNPIVCAITSISFDHTKYLGDTIKKIAAEKCGIIKQNSCVAVYSRLDKAAKSVVEQTCKNTNSNLLTPKKINIVKVGITNIFDYGEYKNLEIHLCGRHQIYNAALAVDIALYLRKYYKISDESIKNGLKNARWICRFEIFDKGKEKPVFVIDGAHNYDGVLSLCDTVRVVFEGKKIITVFGMLNEKDFEKSLESIAKISDVLIITSVPSIRQTDFKKVFETAKKYKKDAVFIENNFDAIKNAALSNNGNSAVLIAGSLYLAGNVRNFVDKF